MVLYVHSLMSYKDLRATINPHSKSKILEDQTLLISDYLIVTCLFMCMYVACYLQDLDLCLQY